ncbi:glycosyltransferase family 87 protein [Almyronema epifaneia]|uniref:Glycosyltransferase family 87 protein n=1 Tax=Almyronema epifaneia S1 TaxID=2991925 RepID=A0ABW6IBW1_9CYAN
MVFEVGLDMAKFQRSQIRYFLNNYSLYFLPLVFSIALAFETYQFDFRTSYVAGKAVLYHLDPYINHVSNFPEFYSPVNAGVQASSGLRYPPLAAILYAPFAFFPYEVAKIIFTVVILLFFGLICFELVKNNRFSLKGEAILFAACSFPIIASVERGQIDLVVLYLTLLSFFCQQKGQSFRAAFCLALAANIKIIPLGVLIYYGLRKQFSFIAQALVSTAILFLLPLPLFGLSVYRHFLSRIFPGIFAEITSPTPINLHGQRIFKNIVESVDSPNLRLGHDFVHGFMNPLLKNSSSGAILCGLILTILFFIAAWKSDKSYQFFGFINTLNLFNPKAWIMGLVWHLPLCFYLYNQVNNRGKFLLLLPLFLPPFLNASAILAYVVSIIFALTPRIPLLSRWFLRDAHARSYERESSKRGLSQPLAE